MNRMECQAAALSSCGDWGGSMESRREESPVCLHYLLVVKASDPIAPLQSLHRLGPPLHLLHQRREVKLGPR